MTERDHLHYTASGERKKGRSPERKVDTAHRKREFKGLTLSLLLGEGGSQVLKGGGPVKKEQATRLEKGN